MFCSAKFIGHSLSLTKIRIKGIVGKRNQDFTVLGGKEKQGEN